MISACHELALRYRTIGAHEQTRRVAALLAITADDGRPRGARFEALRDLAEALDGPLVVDEADADLALDVLEDDLFLDAVVAAGLGWTLFALASLGGQDAVWAATRSLLAVRLETAGERGVALAQLHFDAHQPDRGAAELVAAEPSAPTLRDVWLLLVARWLERLEARSSVVAALRERGIVEQVADELDGLDSLAGAEVDKVREWLLESLK